MEFYSSPTCKRAVYKAYINGRAVIPGWDDKTGVTKVTSIGFSALPAPGIVGTIGLELESNGPCPTLRSLCRGSSTCQWAAFDMSKLCCPLGNIATA